MPGRWVVVVPVKDATAGKTRLSDALDGRSRAALARAMALDTIAVAVGCPQVGLVMVVTADEDVRREAPALAGDAFVGEWSGQAVGDLATRLHTTMPANDPGSLTYADTAALVAYILSVNQFPAGTTALPADLGAMGSINITAEKPAAK